MGYDWYIRSLFSISGIQNALNDIDNDVSRIKRRISQAKESVSRSFDLDFEFDKIASDRVSSGEPQTDQILGMLILSFCIDIHIHGDLYVFLYVCINVKKCFGKKFVVTLTSVPRLISEFLFSASFTDLID